MDLTEYIYKRKSTRRFDLEALPVHTLDTISDFMKTLHPLDDTIEVKHIIVGQQDVKNLLPIKAPHYVVIYSEKTTDYLVNAGFMYQQLDLYFSYLGLGSCWLGMARPAISGFEDLEFIIVIAFGNPQDNAYRNLSEFKRKPLTEMCDCDDSCLEVARLAPSATNSQPWYFKKQEAGYDVYCKQTNLIKKLAYDKMNRIDMGIALAHLYIANMDTFNYFKRDVIQVSGYYYTCSIKI